VAADVIPLIRYATGDDLPNATVGGHYSGKDELEYIGTHGKVERIWYEVDKWWGRDAPYNTLTLHLLSLS